MRGHISNDQTGVQLMLWVLSMFWGLKFPLFCSVLVRPKRWSFIAGFVAVRVHGCFWRSLCVIESQGDRKRERWQ